MTWRPTAATSVLKVWVAVWTMTAWLNAQVAQKVLRVGWRAVPARRVDDVDPDDL